MNLSGLLMWCILIPNSCLLLVGAARSGGLWGADAQQSGGRMQSSGHRLFADRLAQLAAELDDSQVSAVAVRADAAVSVAVDGRPGVGRDCVRRALQAAGVMPAEHTRAGDVAVYVVAEVVKPEDRAAIWAASGPVLLVLNKADLSGLGPRGPIAEAHARCDRYRELTGVPTVPTVAHLAVAELDDELLAALRTLAAEPPDLASTDGFVKASNTVPRHVRARLLERLDLFGIAHCLLALRRRPGADVAAVQQTLHAHSGIDAVVDALSAMAAEIGYLRVLSACRDLEALAVIADDRLAEQITIFFTDDDTVVARMAAAVDVVEAADMTVDPADPHAHVRRAARWQQYARGPVNSMHRACGNDIARGSLRLWRQAT
jgi:hypothetical protein